jgi:hypothetical protein
MLIRFRVLGPVMALALAAVSASPSFAAPSCTRSTPGVSVENTWAWGQTGSWGLAGQKLTYQIQITNYDLGCRSSSFVMSLSAPTGFSVSIPTNTISLKSSFTGYLVAYVTSPSEIADGTSALTVAVQRAGTSSPVTSITYYKTYSSDTVAPTLYWPSVANGQAISGRAYNVSVSSNDEHAVKTIDLYIDNVYKSTMVCDDIAYTCQLAYNWSLSGVQGQHTATFNAYDWMGNRATLTATFTVS